MRMKQLTQFLFLNHEEHEGHEGFNSSCLPYSSWELLKAELSSTSAQTELMPFGYKAELSVLSARTKLMPFGYKLIYVYF
jgi:hypothetical protein